MNKEQRHALFGKNCGVVELGLPAFIIIIQIDHKGQPALGSVLLYAAIYMTFELLACLISIEPHMVIQPNWNSLIAHHWQ